MVFWKVPAGWTLRLDSHPRLLLLLPNTQPIYIDESEWNECLLGAFMARNENHMHITLERAQTRAPSLIKAIWKIPHGFTGRNHDHCAAGGEHEGSCPSDQQGQTSSPFFSLSLSWRCVVCTEVLCVFLSASLLLLLFSPAANKKRRRNPNVRMQPTLKYLNSRQKYMRKFSHCAICKGLFKFEP